MVLETKIDRFLADLKLGVQFFKQAGEKLVEMLDEDPNVFEDIIERSREGWVTLDVLRTFEQIGRKQLAIEAMFLPRHVLERVITYPVGLQTEVSLQKIPVVKQIGARHVTDHKFARDLSVKESRQALGPSGPRGEAEQVKHIKEAKLELVGKKLLVWCDGEFLVEESNSTANRQTIRLNDAGEAEIEIWAPPI